MISSLRKAAAFMFPFQPRRSRWRAPFVFSFLLCVLLNLSLFSLQLSLNISKKNKKNSLDSTIPFSPSSFSSFYSNERRGSRDHGPPGS